jgi:hypothetical protein
LRFQGCEELAQLLSGLADNIGIADNECAESVHFKAFFLNEESLEGFNSVTIGALLF